MKQSILFLCFTFFVWGCSSTCVVTSETYNIRGTVITYAQLNSKIAGEHLRLTTRSGEQLAVRTIKVGQDSSLLIQEPDGRQRSLPTQEILSLETINRSLGAMDGFFTGVYTCGIIGFAYGSKAYTRDDMHGLGVPISTIRSAAGGALLGIILGGGYGHKTTYEFTSGQSDKKPDSASTLSAP